MEEKEGRRRDQRTTISILFIFLLRASASEKAFLEQFVFGQKNSLYAENILLFFLNAKEMRN